MHRTVSAGSIVYDQVAIYFPSNTFYRLSGAIPGNLDLRVFFNNNLLSWNLVDGVSVLDSSISPGSVYFNEIPSAAGYYSIRFFPDLVGYWSISLLHVPTYYENVLNFDVAPSNKYPAPNSGLTASFY